MKNLFLGLVMLVGSASFANTNDPVKEKSAVTVATEKVENYKNSETEDKNADDSLRCSVTIGDVHMSCWFCNCDRLRSDALYAAEYL